MPRSQGTPLRAIQVANVVSEQVYSGHEEVHIDAIERVMRQHQIRRMPVMDDDGHLGQLPANEVASTLAAVSAPRSVLASLA